VAALIFESARAAREEAFRIRTDSATARRVARKGSRLAHARTEKARAAIAAAEARRLSMPLPSPWSSLIWLREDERLSRVLVPLD
jgi:hypothetical protein